MGKAFLVIKRDIELPRPIPGNFDRIVTLNRGNIYLINEYNDQFNSNMCILYYYNNDSVNSQTSIFMTKIEIDTLHAVGDITLYTEEDRGDHSHVIDYLLACSVVYDNRHNTFRYIDINTIDSNYFGNFCKIKGYEYRVSRGDSDINYTHYLGLITSLPAHTYTIPDYMVEYINTRSNQAQETRTDDPLEWALNLDTDGPVRPELEPTNETPVNRPSSTFTITSEGLYAFENMFRESKSVQVKDYSKEKIKIGSKITKEELLSIFKYVPLKVSINQFITKYGFYDKNTDTFISLDKKWKKSKATHNERLKIIYELYDINIKDISDDLAIRSLDAETLFKYCKFKVIDYTKSSKLFGLKELKKGLVGKYVEITNILLKETVKKSKDKENTLFVLTEEGKKVKFCLEDIKIIYPNITGYNPPLDRTIKINDEVKVVNDKKLEEFKKNDITKVHDVKTINNKKYVLIGNKNKVYQPINKFKKYVKRSKEEAIKQS